MPSGVRCHGDDNLICAGLTVNTLTAAHSPLAFLFPSLHPRPFFFLSIMFVIVHTTQTRVPPPRPRLPGHSWTQDNSCCDPLVTQPVAHTHFSSKIGPPLDRPSSTQVGEQNFPVVHAAGIGCNILFYFF